MTRADEHQREIAHLEAAGRLQELGVEVRSSELRDTLARHRHFAENGNRQMRRARARANRQKG